LLAEPAVVAVTALAHVLLEGIDVAGLVWLVDTVHVVHRGHHRVPQQHLHQSGLPAGPKKK